jgi:hypothetical protein
MDAPAGHQIAGVPTSDELLGLDAVAVADRTLSLRAEGTTEPVEGDAEA